MQKEHAYIELVEGGNIFKQGDELTLAFKPRDYEGRVINLSGKTIVGSIFNKNKGVMFETPATWDATNQNIVFKITELLDHGRFEIEFTATSTGYRSKIPSHGNNAVLNIQPSTDDIDFVGVKKTTVTQLRAEQTQLQNQFAAQVLPRVNTVEGKQAQLESDYQAAAANLTQDSEVILARGGEVSLGTRLNKTAEQLAETDGIAKKTKNNIFNVLSYVSTSAAVNDYKNKNGFSLFFPKGDYAITEPFVLSNLDGVEIDGNGSTFNLSGRFDVFVLTNCKNVTIKNLKINVPIGGSSACRLVRAEKNSVLTMLNLSIINGSLASIRSDVLGNPCENITIDGCYAENDVNGISIAGSRHVTIQNSKIKTMSSDGIKISSDRNEHIQIINMDISYCLDDGIDFYADSRFVVVEKSRISNCGKPFNYKYDGELATDNTQLYPNGDNRVYECTIRDNVFKDCGLVQILNASNLLMENNFMTGFSGQFVVAIRGTGTRIPKNIVLKGNKFEKNAISLCTITIELSPILNEYSDIYILNNYFKNNSGTAGEVMPDETNIGFEGYSSIHIKGNTFINGSPYVTRAALGNTSLVFDENFIMNKQYGLRINSATEKSMLRMNGNQLINVPAPLWLSSTTHSIVSVNNVSNDVRNWQRQRGTTAQRPQTSTTSPILAGQKYYDSTLGKEIMWSGSAWINVNGTAL